MPTILAKIKRAIRERNFEVGLHFFEELAADDLSLREALSAIVNAVEFDKLTDDESHIRYRLLGMTETNREIVVVVFFFDGSLFLKTVYEPKF